MKEFDKLTRDELAALTDDQIQRYIDLAMAEEGIRPVVFPTEVDTPKISLVASDTAYEVFGLYFRNKDDADLLAGMDVLDDNYDYNVSYEHKWLAKHPGGTVQTKKFYLQSEVRAISTELKDAKRLKEVYDKQKKEYDSFNSATSSLRSEIWGKVHEARDRVAEVAAAREAFDRYRELADGNADIAERFFRKAYGLDDGLVAEVLGLVVIAPETIE